MPVDGFYFIIIFQYLRTLFIAKLNNIAGSRWEHMMRENLQLDQIRVGNQVVSAQCCNTATLDNPVHDIILII